VFVYYWAAVWFQTSSLDWYVYHGT